MQGVDSHISQMGKIDGQIADQISFSWLVADGRASLRCQLYIIKTCFVSFGWLNQVARIHL